MSARLVGDLIEWRRSPAGTTLTEAEFIVLITIADRVLDEDTRLMKRFRGDNCELHDRICQVVGVNKENLKKILQRLAARGMEVRVEITRDRAGRPVYACRGHAMDFRFPHLPPSVQLPAIEEACG